MKNNKMEEGSAAINVSLNEGRIVVRHSHPNGAILMECHALDGYWDNVWEALTSDKYAKNVRRIFK